MKQTEIPIFFSSDKNYLPYLDVAIRSLVDHTSPKNEYRIYVLTTDITDEDFKLIKELERKNIKINLVDVTDKIIDVRKNLKLRDYYTEAIYFRLFLPTLFPEYNKGIYLDSDIILNDDIAKLFYQSLKGKPIGTVLDACVYTNPNLIYYVREALDVNEKQYFNSGVLLMNLDKFREMDIEKKFYDFFNKYDFGAVAPDQDFLNILFNNKTLHLGRGWNAMPNSCLPVLENENLHLIHYNLFMKPWKYDNLPYADYFWKYAKESPYYEQIMNRKSKITDEEKEKDINGVEQLCKYAMEIANSDYNYRKIVLNKKRDEIYLQELELLVNKMLKNMNSNDDGEPDEAWA